MTQAIADHVDLICQTSPPISGESEPTTESPLAVACMPGSTATRYTDNHRNSVFQHEDWPAQGVIGGDRRMHDDDHHEATLRNFSTCGGCAYGEKRCAPLFPGRSTFDPTLHSDTKMPHYDGAGASRTGGRRT